MRWLLVSIVVFSAAAPAGAASRVRMKPVGRSVSNLVTDHRRAAAWVSAPGFVTVARDGLPRLTTPLPAGCRLAWVTRRIMTAGCDAPVERPLLIDLATGREIPTPGDPFEDAAFTVEAAGTRWLQGRRVRGNGRRSRIWIDRATGADRTGEDRHVVADLDAPDLFVALCEPLVRHWRARSRGFSLSSMQIEGQWALDSGTRLRHCGRRRSTRVPRGALLAPGWLAWKRAAGGPAQLRRLRDGKRFVGRPALPAGSKIALTRGTVFALRPGGRVMAAKLPR